MENFRIIKITNNKKEFVDDVAASEIPLTINIGGKELVTLLCSPFDVEDLARGFLLTSGLVKKSDEIKKIIINKEQWTANVELTDNKLSEDLVFKRLYTSGCGRGTLFYNIFDIANRSKIISDIRIESIQISKLMADFQKKSEGYLKTGGVHSAALSDGNEIIAFKEDIGRHNAIDKVVGNIIAINQSLSDTILLTSGRISSEVIFKARKCSISIIISRSAPTNQAVRLAREMDMTLVGFARGNRMNIYSVEERIVYV